MRANKLFCVIAYDIVDDHRRNQLVKVIEKYGIRVNYSVFECMFTDSQFKKVQDKIDKILKRKEDAVIYYPICVDCFSKIIYQPNKRITSKTIIIC